MNVIVLYLASRIVQDVFKKERRFSQQSYVQDTERERVLWALSIKRLCSPYPNHISFPSIMILLSICIHEEEREWGRNSALKDKK